MGLFGKLFKGPEADMEKSDANRKKMRSLFNQIVEHREDYNILFGYTEDVGRFNYGLVHGSKTKIGNLIIVPFLLEAKPKKQIPVQLAAIPGKYYKA